MAKIIRVLGSEKCYLMDDGTKVPFAEKGKIIMPSKKIETVSIDEAVEVLEQKPKKKKRSYKRKK